MVEYFIVLAFGIIVLTTGDPSPMKKLADVIKQNWKGYSYAIALSDIPDTVDMGQAQFQYLSDGKNPGSIIYATDHMQMLTDMNQHIRDISAKLPNYCSKMPKIRLTDVTNGILGLGGGENAPLNKGC